MREAKPITFKHLIKALKKSHGFKDKVQILAEKILQTLCFLFFVYSSSYYVLIL